MPADNFHDTHHFIIVKRFFEMVGVSRFVAGFLPTNAHIIQGDLKMSNVFFENLLIIHTTN